VITHNRRKPTYHSSDIAIATVSSDGVVFGVASGTAWIVAESGGKKDSAQIKVTPTPPSRIDLSPEFPVVYVNDTTRVGVTPRNAAGSAITDYTVNCQIANNSLATVVVSAKTCLLRGAAQGSTTLLVTVNGVDKQATVIVRQAKADRVTLGIRKPIREGEDVPLDLQLFANNVPLSLTGRTFSYQTSNATVATVNSQTGVVHAVRAGTATITVTTEENLKASVDVEVTKVPVQTVIIGPKNAQFRIGLTGAMALAAYDSLSSRIADLTGRNISFRSLDETVLRIAPSGVVTTVKIGTTKVIGSVDGIADTTDVRVTELPTARVVIDSNQVQRFPGGTFQYTATVFDSLNNVVSGRPIRWTSNSLAVEVNSATGFARAVGPGVATITAEVAKVAGLPDLIGGQATFVVRQTPAARVVVAPTTLSIRPGQTVFIGVTVVDSADKILFGRETTVRAVYSNPGIVLVDPARGTVQGIGSGTTTVTLQALDQFGLPEGQPATLTVSVTQ
jgi:uncharacterized protein YjdB